MNPLVKAALSALNAGALAALLVAYSNAPAKLIALAFGIHFCKSLQDLYTPAPGQNKAEKESTDG